MAAPTVGLGLALLLAGGGALALAAAEGDVRLSLLLVFPLLTGEGPLAAAGMVLVALGFVAVLVGLGRREGEREGAGPTAVGPRLGGDEPAPACGEREGARGRGAEGERPPTAPARPSRSRGAGVILVGPIPIAWGSDKRGLITALVLALLIMLAASAFVVLSRTG